MDDGEPDDPTSRADRRPSPIVASREARALLSVVAAAGLAALAACSAADPPEGLEPVERFEWAHERFEQGDWGAAENGFNDFLLSEPLSSLADSAQFLLGETRYRDGRYVEAAETYGRLVNNRPTSSLADDAQLGVCRSHWARSPDLALDQGQTRQAVAACQRLLELYPDSPLTDRAEEIRTRARHKLAAKRFRVGSWYFDNEIYQSANIYFEGILEEYPSAPIVPEVLARLYRSYVELGFDAEARSVRERLLEEHGDTQAAAQVRDEPPPGSGP